jgi:hypothetical protein
MFASTFALLLAFATPTAEAQCYNRLTQDLNCNAVDAVDEVAVDLEDPLCAEKVDEFGNPYPNADYYVEYFAFGCEHLTVDMDVDGDGLSQGNITFIDTDGLPSTSISLACDNCPEIPNND